MPSHPPSLKLFLCPYSNIFDVSTNYNLSNSNNNPKLANDYRTCSATTLAVLYDQILHSQTPARIFGREFIAKADEAREAYRTFALRIHPDKAPDDSPRDFHTSSFKKVHFAYDELLTTRGSAAQMMSMNSMLYPRCLKRGSRCTPALSLSRRLCA